MQHKDVIVVVSRHDDCGVPPSMPETCVDTKSHSVPRTHAASRKGPLDGADPPSFSAGMVDPAQILLMRASQFDPVIDKERKFISN